MISLREHLDHYPYYLSSKEVSSISLRYPSLILSCLTPGTGTTYIPNLPPML